MKPSSPSARRTTANVARVGSGTPFRESGRGCAARTANCRRTDGEQLGQLEVAGAVLFDEYLGNPSKTAESMTEDGWFRTGDIAVIDDSGFHRIVGRESVDMIKSGGYRIGAGEVEQALLAYPGVREAAVVGMPDDDLGQRIVALLIVGDVADCAVVSDFVAESLSIHKAPTPGLSGGQLAAQTLWARSRRSC